MYIVVAPETLNKTQLLMYWQHLVFVAAHVFLVCFDKKFYIDNV